MLGDHFGAAVIGQLKTPAVHFKNAYIGLKAGGQAANMVVHTQQFGRVAADHRNHLIKGHTKMQ